ncbi:acetate uptake transporter [Cryobacterium sp. W22_MBD10_FK3]|uniref:acetate uptake transporter n=1 Tax=Cryobacterium sp. W22_MBD10_FK3 TaxID=3240273 RepID=UPI003F93A2B2
MNQINTTVPEASVVSAPAPAPVPAAPSHGALADPGALGLAAFALTTFVLSMSNTGIVPSSAAVLGLALFYGGIAQVIAGIWEFYNRNTFGATAFTSFGAFWLAFWYLESTGGNVEAGAAGMGTFLLAWAIFTVYMTVAAKKTNGSIFAVFVALSITFLLLAIGAFTGITAIHQLGGWFGILTALLAWYGSFAVVYNSTAGRAVLPVWPSK